MEPLTQYFVEVALPWELFQSYRNFFGRDRRPAPSNGLPVRR
jgi:hypothetical protein